MSRLVVHLSVRSLEGLCKFLLSLAHSVCLACVREIESQRFCKLELLVFIQLLLKANASLTAFAMRANPYVEHDAQETAVVDDSEASRFIPIKTVCESSLAGAKKTTFLAPAFK